MSIVDRRTLLQATPWLGVLPFLGLAACGRGQEFSCGSGEGLEQDVKKARRRLGYLEPSPDAVRSCDACTQYLEGRECGSCKIMPGPVHPLGTCNAFSPRA